MPLVNEASELPCIIWRNKNDWNLDYLNLPQEKAEEYFEDVKLKDPCALFVTGADFSRGSYPFVYDEVLTARLRAEHNNSEEYHALINFLEDNIGEFSGEATDYIASLEKPLAELNEIYLNCLNTKSLYDKLDDAFDLLIEQVEMRADDGIKASIIALVIPKDVDNSAYVKFPASAEEISAAVKTDNIDNCRIGNISCGKIPLLSFFMDNIGSSTTIKELQYVSEIVSTLTPEEHETVSAYLEMKLTSTADLLKRDIKTETLSVMHVMDALENRGFFRIDKTIKTDEDIGNQKLDAAFENCGSAIKKLSLSNDESDKDLMKFINLLNDNFDIAAYGQKIREENNMYITSKGVLSIDGFLGRVSRDIPENINDFTPPENGKSSILKQVEENKAKIAKAEQPGTAKKKETNIE